MPKDKNIFTIIWSPVHYIYRGTSIGIRHKSLYQSDIQCVWIPHTQTACLHRTQTGLMCANMIQGETTQWTSLDTHTHFLQFLLNSVTPPNAFVPRLPPPPVSQHCALDESASLWLWRAEWCMVWPGTNWVPRPRDPQAPHITHPLLWRGVTHAPKYKYKQCSQRECLSITNA